MKTIRLCADDFGQDALINEAVLELFAHDRLSATSVLIDGPFIYSYVDEIAQAHKDGLEIGLHFNLTLPLGNQSSLMRPLNTWIVMSQLRLINSQKILKAFQSQLSCFEDTFGFVPDFVDGHQHVHQFPIIAPILLNELKVRYNKPGSITSQSFPWIRNTKPPRCKTPIPESLKCTTLELLGGARLKTLLLDQHFLTNEGFLGIYRFNLSSPDGYQAFMQAWLDCAQEHSLIMCHPAKGYLENNSKSHPANQRLFEYTYLNSEKFQEDLNARQIKLHKAPNL